MTGSNELLTSAGMSVRIGFAAAVFALLTGATGAEGADSAPGVGELVNGYCRDCHSGRKPAGELDLVSAAGTSVGERPAVWEKVIRKLRAGQMPPRDAEQPQPDAVAKALGALEGTLDEIATAHPRPGRPATFRRLTRAEYRNAIRDLLALEVDAASLLPADGVSHGFDNLSSGELSPTVLNRYISAAQQISRLAMGRTPKSPDGKTFRVRPDVTQEGRMEGLPLGTRGGTAISYTFPRDGEYEIRVRLTRDRNEHVEGLSGTHEMELLLDLERVKLFTVKPPARTSGEPGDYGAPSHENVDRHLVARVKVAAGPHEVGATFLKQSSSLLETKRQPLHVHYNMYRHPRLSPAIYEVSITGPFESSGPGDTPSRRRIFVCRPTGSDDEEACARKIIAHLLRRACRRPIGDDDLARPMAVYRAAREEGDFEAGIEMAVASILVHPRFLFRIEQDPEGVPAGTAYRISDVELASRLSFFLWSSIPDEELLALAERGELSRPEVLERQTRRMLADKRSRALVDDFAGQWLYLRNLDSATPDGRLYPDFGDNLRQAFRRETELFFESIVQDDRSVLDLLKADYTFLNERLAQHYGIPHVYGSRFRRVSLDPDSRRGGLLRQGSILTVTSYATRTSPVIRGKWILENLLGTPPPPPPPNVPALRENTVDANLPVRERLAQHRADAACASCHDLIDPVGFSLENFDAVGRWRDLENGKAVDASGGLPDGSEFTGAAGLEAGLLERPDVFVNTMTEKLLTYALGRVLDYYDGPAVRKIVREAKGDGYRFSSLVLGIVKSTPFQMRASP